MPSATKMPPRIIKPYPIFCVDSKSFIYSSYLLSSSIQSSHSLSILLNKNAPPMAMNKPPTIGVLVSFMIDLTKALESLWSYIVKSLFQPIFTISLLISSLL